MSFKLAAFDFDYTLVNLNSCNYLNKLVISRQQQATNKAQTPSIATLNKFKYPQEIEEQKEKFHSIARMNHIFKYMSTHFNISKDDLIRCLSEIKIGEPMKELLRSLKKRNFDLIIISDSNTFVIETILSRNDLFELFDNDVNKIIANKANFNENGCLEVTPLNELHLPHGETFDCPTNHCKANICKGFLLENYVNKALEKHPILKRDQVIYVGDGLIDYCAGLRLNSKDLFFVKQNSKLSKLLNESINLNKKICAQIKLWKNANEIIKQLTIE